MLSQRISQKDNIRIAIIGIGYVGLPLAIKLAETGFSVVGVDISQSSINKLLAGKTTVEGIDSERIVNVIRNTGTLSLLKVNEVVSNNTAETIKRLTGIDIFVVCVPTPLHRDRGWDPETGSISEAADLIRLVCETEDNTGQLPKERLIVLESTTYPQTTRNIFSPIKEDFEKKGMKCLLAYSPERTSPGPESHKENNADCDDENPDEAICKSTFEITRIVGGIDEDSTNTANEFYKTVFQKTYPVANLETAEMIKLVENTFRFVSIGFANEMARVAKAFNLNIWEIIKAAKTKKFGLDICYPGLVGGHCLPIDPHYLGWAYRNRRSVATFVEVAEKSHQDARRDALELIQRLLSQHEKGVPKASILFFGVAYKKDVADTRESGVLDLMKKLFSYGAVISFWDPLRAHLEVNQPVRIVFSETEYEFLPEAVGARLEETDEHQYMTEPNELTGSWQELRSRILSQEFDCVVLATDHTSFHETYFELLSNESAPPVADLNNAVKSWLKDEKIEPGQAEELKNSIDDRSRYMLFGYS